MTELYEILILWVCVVILSVIFRELVRHMKKQGKRMFGFNCDMCEGKYRNGKPLYRCGFKKPILNKLIQMGIVKSNNPKFLDGDDI
jgi:hypothetical protein